MPALRSTPWDFHNTDKSMLSANNCHRLVFYQLGEIAMGAPLGGKCYLEDKDKLKLKINDWCGGPPVWETSGRLVALPIWVRYPDQGTVQHIGVVDTMKKELKIFLRTFSVLDLRSFDGNVIRGLASLARGYEEVAFDILKEEISKTSTLAE